MKLLVEQFIGPMPEGVLIAIVIESVLKSWLDIGISVLLSLQFINGVTGFTETNKMGNEVAALKATLKPISMVMREGSG